MERDAQLEACFGSPGVDTLSHPRDHVLRPVRDEGITDDGPDTGDDGMKGVPEPEFVRPMTRKCDNHAWYRSDMIMLIGVLVAVGVIVWAINYAIPMEPMFKRAVTAVAIVCVVLYALKVFGVFTGNPHFPN